MRRDLNLVRKILMAVEECDDDYINDLEIPQYSYRTVNYHLELMSQAGLLKAEVFHAAQEKYLKSLISEITWNGHDFLDAVRNDTVWRKTKSQINKLGGSITFEAVKKIALKIALDSLP